MGKIKDFLVDVKYNTRGDDTGQVYYTPEQLDKWKDAYRTYGANSPELKAAEEDLLAKSKHDNQSDRELRALLDKQRADLQKEYKATEKARKKEKAQQGKRSWFASPEEIKKMADELNKTQNAGQISRAVAAAKDMDKSAGALAKAFKVLGDATNNEDLKEAANTLGIELADAQKLKEDALKESAETGRPVTDVLAEEYEKRQDGKGNAGGSGGTSQTLDGAAGEGIEGEKEKQFSITSKDLESQKALNDKFKELLGENDISKYFGRSLWSMYKDGYFGEVGTKAAKQRFGYAVLDTITTGMSNVFNFWGRTGNTDQVPQIRQIEQSKLQGALERYNESEMQKQQAMIDNMKTALEGNAELQVKLNQVMADTDLKRLLARQDRSVQNAVLQMLVDYGKTVDAKDLMNGIKMGLLQFLSGTGGGGSVTGAVTSGAESVAKALGSMLL